jgi:ligand-binding SRPBCC domain-containing protein
MGIAVNWDNDERTAIRFTFASGWTWENFRNTLSEVDTILAEVGYKVDVIMDLSDGQTVPSSATYYAREALRWIPPYWKTVIVVSDSPSAIDTWAEVHSFYRNTGRTLYLADSVAQARSLLALSHGISPITTQPVPHDLARHNR